MSSPGVDVQAGARQEGQGTVGSQTCNNIQPVQQHMYLSMNWPGMHYAVKAAFLNMSVHWEWSTSTSP